MDDSLFGCVLRQPEKNFAYPPTPFPVESEHYVRFFLAITAPFSTVPQRFRGRGNELTAGNTQSKAEHPAGGKLCTSPVKCAWNHGYDRDVRAANVLKMPHM